MSCHISQSLFFLLSSSGPVFQLSVAVETKICFQEPGRNVNIGTQEVEAEQEGEGRHRNEQHRGLIGKVTNISVANCGNVTIDMASVAGGSEFVPNLTIENVANLHLKADNDKSKKSSQKLERPEPRSWPSSHSKAFFAQNVTMACNQNTFYRAGYHKIGNI